MPCPLCNDAGMVPRPGDWKEDGYWEDCPMCYPPKPAEPLSYRIMGAVQTFLGLFLTVLFLPLWPVFYYWCRMTAKPCPKCGEDWYTELVGEWDGEHWKCHTCKHYWETKE